jgi:hypothetical protein
VPAIAAAIELVRHRLINVQVAITLPVAQVVADSVVAPEASAERAHARAVVEVHPVLVVAVAVVEVVLAAVAAVVVEAVLAAAAAAVVVVVVVEAAVAEGDR